MKNSNAIWHILAITTIIFWGTSFVSTKVLLNYNFSAVQIFFIRFIFTYLLLLAIEHRQGLANSLKDEFILFICGLTGGTLYFWGENSALSLSPSSNVSLIVCTNPLLIMIFGGILYKSERLSKRQIIGSFITFFGMVLVVLNGRFILKLSPTGDLLAFSASCVWAIYSLVVRMLNGKYSALFITRKFFFYSVLSTIPILLVEATGNSTATYTGFNIPWESFQEPVVILNFLCLGIFSSLFGYLVWNKVLAKLGTVLASNYIYGIPLVTIITAMIALQERITLMAWCGAATIITGMVLAEYRKHQK